MRPPQIRTIAVAWCLGTGPGACTSGPPELAQAAEHAPPPDVPVQPPLPETPAPPTPTLRVVLEGHGTLSGVGDRPVFGPHDAGFRRLPAIVFGHDGRIADRVALPVRDGIFAVGGHWPTPLFAQGAWGDRGAPDDPFIMVRFGDTWKDTRHVKGRDSSNQWVFPWHEQSLLALSNAHEDSNRPPRLGVIAGPTRAPKLAPVLSESGCRESRVASVAVDIDGPVALTLHCRDGRRWLVYWSGDGSPAESRPLAERSPTTRSSEIRPALGPQGAALFAYLDGDRVVTERRVEGQWQTSSIPQAGVPNAGAPLRAAVTEDDTWVLTAATLYQETDAGWAAVDVPGEGAFRMFAGLDTGSPWIVREGPGLWWRDARGTWVEIAVPRSPFEGAPYDAITEILAFGPRDAWIEATTAHTKHRIRDRYARALLTTRPAPAPVLAACSHGRGSTQTHCDHLAWPTVDRACTKQLALVVDRHTGAAAGHYRPLRKALAASPLPGAPPTFVEAKIGHVEVLAAWVESYDQGLALLERAPWKRPAYPRPVCGDEASLGASALVLGEAVDVMQAPRARSGASAERR